MSILSEVETRVLGSLVEKELTTPEYYPLSLNALVNACNQKSNRDPVMNLNENAVSQALRSLESVGFELTVEFPATFALYVRQKSIFPRGHGHERKKTRLDGRAQSMRTHR